ncbi:MAG: hypothetical protein HY675_03605 [Chloroflexi bacterium]|nr:hypothetical protein [Chloroflexota bacterium]
MPPLRAKAPWYGYSLGHRTKENEAEAEFALQGEYYQTGEKLAKNRIELYGRSRWQPGFAPVHVTA